MNCDELVEEITAYLEGTHPDPARVDAHLAECPFCQTYLDQMRATIDRLGRVDPEALAPDARAQLLDAFRRR